MENKIRIRRDFAPLNISCTLYCYTNATSPLTQTYDTLENTYIPNRSLVPCVVTPKVLVDADDGSWANLNTNQNLSNIKWYANDIDISTMVDWNGLYSIDSTSTYMRGSLTILRNIGSAERFVLKMKATFTDTRQNINVNIESDEVVLTTTDKGEDTWAIYISNGNSVLYNPLKDKLLEYDYKLSHNIDVGDDTEQSVTDSNSYRYVLPIQVVQGGKVPISSYTVKMYEVINDIATEKTANGEEILSLSNTSCVLDLRLIGKTTYMFQVVSDNIIKAQKTISVDRILPTYSVKAKNIVDISPNDRFMYEELAFNYNGNIVKYPQPIFSVKWSTANKDNITVQQGVGCSTIIDMDRAQVGKDSINDYADISFDTKVVEKFGFVVGNSYISGVLTEIQLVDNSGTDLIEYIIN